MVYYYCCYYNYHPHSVATATHQGQLHICARSQSKDLVEPEFQVTFNHYTILPLDSEESATGYKAKLESKET